MTLADPKARRAAAARERAAADAARAALRQGLERAASAARSGADDDATAMAAAAAALRQAPGAVATHTLQDALVAVRLLHGAPAGIPAAATLAIDVLLDGGRLHLRRHGLLVLSVHAFGRIAEREASEADIPDWCAAALPAVAGLAASWPDGDAACPFGPGILLGTIGPTPTIEDAARLAQDGPLPCALAPLGRTFVGRTWVPEPVLVPAQVHLLRRLRRWTAADGADAVADLCGQERPRASETLRRIARSRAWRRCPRTA